MPYKVRYSVIFELEADVNDTFSLKQHLDGIRVPESRESKYLSNSFRVEGVLDPKDREITVEYESNYGREKKKKEMR
jgi:hypothetical protein